jgi:hypothetical protein
VAGEIAVELVDDLPEPKPAQAVILKDHQHDQGTHRIENETACACPLWPLPFATSLGKSAAPEPADRHSGQSITEWQRVGTCVQDDTGLEAWAELVAQVAQAREVDSGGRGARLDLDSDDVAVVALDDDVNLPLLLVAIVDGAVDPVAAPLRRSSRAWFPRRRRPRRFVARRRR